MQDVGLDDNLPENEDNPQAKNKVATEKEDEEKTIICHGLLIWICLVYEYMLKSQIMSRAEMFYVIKILHHKVLSKFIIISK